MSQLELANWIALYAATGMCCAIALMLSAAVVMVQLWQERSWRDRTSIADAALFLPKAWWRWQKLYLLSAPVTLAIVSFFAATLRWA